PERRPADRTCGGRGGRSTVRSQEHGPPRASRPSTGDASMTRPPEVAIPVSLRDRIQSDVTAAMRSGDALRRDVLRMAQYAVYLIEKRDRRELSDDEVAAVLGREVKTRRESVEA